MELCSDARQTERHHSPRVNALAKAGIELEENEPDIEEAPEKGGLANRGFRGLGPCVEGVRTLHAAIVLQRHGHAMGIQWATARIRLGVVRVPRARRNAIAKAGVELGRMAA